MNYEQLAVVRGWADTRAALRVWQRRPVATVGPWAAGSLVVAVLLLLATWVVALLSMPDPSGFVLQGVGRVGQWDDFFFIMYRNSLVLGLHAMACVAGFMAGSSLRSRPGPVRLDAAGARPLGQARDRVRGARDAVLARHAGLSLGADAATAAADRDMSPGWLLIGLLPHALPELGALFLPLAAWIIASRRGAWNTLLAATFVTTAIAVPVLVAAAAFEVWVTPHVLYFLK